MQRKSSQTQDTNATPIPGMQISTWVDLSGNDRHMNNVNGDPTIAMDGYEEERWLILMEMMADLHI